MAEQPTCGQGLAEHSSLPARLGELTASAAEILAAHIGALDLEDEHARSEHGVYLTLTEQHRRTAAELRATGREMAGYRDLPMGRHDPAKMSSPKAVEAFEGFVKAERELLALLHERLRKDQEMLTGMRSGG